MQTPTIFVDHGIWAHIQWPANQLKLISCNIPWLVFSKYKYLSLIEVPDVCFNNPVGVTNQSIIPDNQLSASSSYLYDNGTVDYPFYGRLHGSRGDGWCALTRGNINDWFQVDLGKAFAMCGVATQGAISTAAWVIDFKLNFSSDGNTWTTYKYENGTEVVRLNWFYFYMIVCDRRELAVVNLLRFHSLPFSPGRSRGH